MPRAHLVQVFVLRLRRSSIRCGGAALLFGAVLVTQYQHQSVAGDLPVSPINILTFNIMWEENGVRAGNLSLPVWADRKERVAELILQSKADIVGFQEASPEQQEGLRQLLPDFSVVYHKATNNSNPIMFRTARFTQLDSGVFVLNTKPEIEGTNIGVRSSTWVRLKDLRSGRQLWVYSLHLDHRSKGPTRQISTVRLVERIVDHEGAVVVTGDFNTSENSPEMLFFHGRSELENDDGKRVKNERPLTSAYRSIHPENTRRVIDHVLVSQEAHVRDAGRIPSRQASDHDVFWASVQIE